MIKHKEHKDHRESQLILLNVLCVLCVSIRSGVAQDSSAAKVFERQIRVVMGSRETQEECREFAKVEARRAVLDQVGVYIEGRSDLMERVRETYDSPLLLKGGSKGGLQSSTFSDSTDLQKRVLAIAAGVTQLEVAGEEWKSEGGALVLYLTCRVTVHPDEVARQLTELVKDRQKVEDYERVQSEVARLRKEMAGFREAMDQAPQVDLERMKREIADLRERLEKAQAIHSSNIRTEQDRQPNYSERKDAYGSGILYFHYSIAPGYLLGSGKSEDNPDYSRLTGRMKRQEISVFMGGTGENEVVGLMCGYVNCSSKSIRVNQSKSYRYRSDSYYLGLGIAAKELWGGMYFKLGYGNERFNGAPSDGIFSDLSTFLQLPIGPIAFGTYLGFSGITNLEETPFSDAIYFIGVSASLKFNW